MRFSLVAKFFSSVNVISALPNFHTNSIQFSSTIFFSTRCPPSKRRHSSDELESAIHWMSLFLWKFQQFCAICTPKKACKHFKRMSKSFFPKKAGKLCVFILLNSIHWVASPDTLETILSIFIQCDLKNANDDVAWINYSERKSTSIQMLSEYLHQLKYMQMFR